MYASTRLDIHYYSNNFKTAKFKTMIIVKNITLNLILITNEENNT